MQTDTATFVIQMVDPCDPPVSITSPGLTNQVYTITDANATPYMHPTFVPNPSYCPVIYSYQITEFFDSNNVQASAVSQDLSNEKIFNFFYN